MSSFLTTLFDIFWQKRTITAVPQVRFYSLEKIDSFISTSTSTRYAQFLFR